MHYPESRYYIRRVRLSINSELIPYLKKAGYHLEPASNDPNNTMIVEFPIDSGEGIRTADDISMWEQLAFAAFLQKYWSDNQVSCTVTFDPVKEGPQLSHALDIYQFELKGVSFLPKLPKGAYPQMPYEAISSSKYKSMMSNIKTIKPFSVIIDDNKEVMKKDTAVIEVPDKFCDVSGCGATI